MGYPSAVLNSAQIRDVWQFVRTNADETHRAAVIDGWMGPQDTRTVSVYMPTHDSL